MAARKLVPPEEFSRRRTDKENYNSYNNPKTLSFKEFGAVILGILFFVWLAVFMARYTLGL